MNAEKHCRHWLQLQSVAVVGTQIQFTIAQENLVDGFWYSLKVPHSIPISPGTNTVAIVNGTGGAVIQLTDWRARVLLSERILRGGERFRMVYTENSIDNTPIFLVREGIVPIP